MKMSMLHQLFLSATCCFLFFLLLLSDSGHFVGAQGIGVTITRECKAPPPPRDIVALCLKFNAKRVRLYDAYKDRDLLEAFRTQLIQVTVGVSNDDVIRIARGDQSVAVTWLKNNIVPFVNSVNFRCIVVGHDMVRVSVSFATAVYQAVVHLHKAQSIVGIMIPMGVEVNHDLLVLNENTFVPSDGQFDPKFAPIIRNILQVLHMNAGVLLVDLYPVTRYYAEYYEYKKLPLEFVLMGQTDFGVLSELGFSYHNIYVSSVEMFYWAMEKVGMSGMRIMVGETGWPSDGQREIATAANAAVYTNHLVERLNTQEGTPRRKWPIETFIRTLYVQDKLRSRDGYGLFYTSGVSANPSIKFTQF
ncbi:Glucan endo-1,3-beta-glucosidase, acidic isoform PR-Q' [Linum grandiflorum]